MNSRNFKAAFSQKMLKMHVLAQYCKCDWPCSACCERAIFDSKKVDDKLREICLEIEKRYEIKFLEIGADQDHVNFLVQSVPMYSVKKSFRW